jgi:hypothetical protein
MISRLTHYRQFYTLAVRAALQRAIIELRHIGETLRQPQPHDEQQESHCQPGEAAGEAVIVLPPLSIAVIPPGRWPYRVDGSQHRQGQEGTERECQRLTPPQTRRDAGAGTAPPDVGYMPENPGASPPKPFAASLVGVARMLR